MRIRKPALTVIATLGALLGALALAAAPALAAEGWGITSTFGTAGSGNGQFASPDGVAINQSTGDVFVVDKHNNRVEWFNSAGDYEGQFNGSGTGPDEDGAAPEPFLLPSGIAVDNSSGPSKGDVYVYADIDNDPGAEPPIHGDSYVNKFEPQADGKYKFVYRFGIFGPAEPGAVAVDPSGNLWVYGSSKTGSEGGLVEEFAQAGGEKLNRFEEEEYLGPTPAIAVDSADNFYRSNVSEQLTKDNLFDEQLDRAETERIRPVRSLAIDPSTNGLYVGLERTIAQYGPFGEPFGTPIHGSGIVAGKAEGIAVNSTTGAVYLADSTGNDVAVLGLGPVPSAPSTEAVESITTTTATLTGTVALNATLNTEYHFDYKIGGGGAECTGQSATAAASAGTGAGGQAVSSAITALQPNLPYSACLVSTNKFDSAGVMGAAVHFTTPPAPPAVSGVGASSVTPFTARLEALVNPNNQVTTCEVQYGTTTAYGSELPCGAILEGFNEPGDGVGVNVTGLEPQTTYHFRVVAVNATHEKTESADHEFTTLAAEKPVIEREGSSVQSPSAATLEATVNPNYQETTCEFEYATEAALIGTPSATTVPCPHALGSGGGAVGTSVALSGLTPETPYYYRVLATNATGTTTDPTIEKFETAPTIAPLISAESATAVTQTTVSLSAQVNPEFQPLTVCEFVLSGGIAPVSCNPSAAGLGEGGGSVPTGASVTGLAANTEYHYKVHAKNASGLSEGAGQSFLTLPNPPAVSTGGASSITLAGATISGTVNPGAAGQPAQDETTYYFQYGPTAIYGQGESYAKQTPMGQAGEGESAKAETASLTGLEPGTIYHYRIVASNHNARAPQVVYGEDRTFTTVAKSPILGGISVSGITETSATIATTINGQGLATSYELWYGTTPGELELSVAGNATATGSFGAQPLQLNLDTLEPGAVYYYKFVVANPDGTVESPEASFTMVPGPTVPPGLLVITPLLPLPDIAFPPEEAGTITPPTKALTKEQKLNKALKACRKEKPKGKRARCERHAHKQYGPKKKK